MMMIFTARDKSDRLMCFCTSSQHCLFIIGSAEALPILCVRCTRCERERDIQRERDREKERERERERERDGSDVTLVALNLAKRFALFSLPKTLKLAKSFALFLAKKIAPQFSPL